MKLRGIRREVGIFNGTREDDLDKEAGAIGAILEAALPEEMAPDEDAKDAE